MAIVKPFKAIRPNGAPGKAELDRLLGEGPLSLTGRVDPTGAGKLQDEIRGRYLNLLSRGLLRRDDSPGFYLYRIEREGQMGLGLFCACSVVDYRKGLIKRHEDTLWEREVRLAEYLYRVGFNAEPVLMTYPDHAGIDQIVRAKLGEVPDFGFCAADGGVHTLWSINSPRDLAQIEEIFAPMEALYIADGHHRSASSDLLALRMEEGNPSHCGSEAYNYFMAYLIPESQIKIDQYNRMVKDLNGRSTLEFLNLLARDHRVQKWNGGPERPLGKHEFVMYLEGSFHSLYLSPPHAHGEVSQALDTQTLFETVLRPILGISDPRNGQRISYVHGKDNLKKMKELVDRGEFAVGFSLLPTPMAEIKALADAGLTMPPKSTYFEPKPKSGLAIYEL